MSKHVKVSYSGPMSHLEWLPSLCPMFLGQVPDPAPPSTRIKWIPEEINGLIVYLIKTKLKNKWLNAPHIQQNRWLFLQASISSFVPMDWVDKPISFVPKFQQITMSDSLHSSGVKDSQLWPCLLAKNVPVWQHYEWSVTEVKPEDFQFLTARMCWKIPMKTWPWPVQFKALW